VRSRRRLLVIMLLVAAGAVLVGVLSSDTTHRRPPTPRSDGLVQVQTVAYRSSLDGSRITGLVATPRASVSRGCVIWQYGLGSRKEDSSKAWQVLAALGLTTFSIDFRHHGARGGLQELEHVVRNPKSIAELIRGTVADLRSAVEYLDKQSYCHRNIAYAGISLGGIVGSMLAATDNRVKAAVFMSTPGTVRAVLNTPGVPVLPGIARDPARLQAALQVLSPLNPARFIGRISPRPIAILSGLDDKIVTISNARLLQKAARRPKTIVDYRGGHDPTSGPAASSNGRAVAGFLLRYVVEPTYGISGNANGTFRLR
jgi:dienelactone hydrolase